MMMDKILKNRNSKEVEAYFSRLESLCSVVELNKAEILRELNTLKQRILGEEGKEQLTLSAQLSIYPLRRPSLSATINEAIAVLEAHDLTVIPGSMSTLILGDKAKLWPALQEVFTAAAAHGELVMIGTLSNACLKPPGEGCADA
jgi:uncharacterized protein YqgV (UPF0045/DUF77 family)